MIKSFSLAAITTAGTGELISNTELTGEPMTDLLIKILLPLISGVLAPAITKLVDAWAYRIKTNIKTKKEKKQNDKDKESNQEISE